MPSPQPLAERIATAREAVQAQLALCPDAPDPPRVAAFAQALVGRRDAALTAPQPLLPLFTQACAAAADDDTRLALCTARAGLVSHSLALAHTHTRLNAAQIHNAVRQRLGITDSPEEPAHRRALFAAINAALDDVTPGGGGFRRAAGGAGLGRAADDDGGADRQARGRVGAGALPDRRDRDRLHAARRAVARPAVRHRAAYRDQPAVRNRRSAGTGRDGAGGGAAQPALPRLPAARPAGWRCSSATPIPAAMSASSPPAT